MRLGARVRWARQLQDGRGVSRLLLARRERRAARTGVSEPGPGASELGAEGGGVVLLLSVASIVQVLAGARVATAHDAHFQLAFRIAVLSNSL